MCHNVKCFLFDLFYFVYPLGMIMLEVIDVIENEMEWCETCPEGFPLEKARAKVVNSNNSPHFL